MIFVCDLACELENVHWFGVRYLDTAEDRPVHKLEIYASDSMTFMNLICRVAMAIATEKSQPSEVHETDTSVMYFDPQNLPHFTSTRVRTEA